MPVHRVLVVESDTRRLISVYAPNNHADREDMFSMLRPWVHGHRELVLAGDFNCVLQPTKDRNTNGVWRTEATESATLSELERAAGLVDAREITEPVDTPPCIRRLTYWKDGSGARLDRCYVSASMASAIVDSNTVLSARHTDHLGVVTWVRDNAATEILKPLAPNLYPVTGRDQQQVDMAVGRALHEVVLDADKGDQPWDQTLSQISKVLRGTKRRERQRATRQRKRRDARLRRRIETLADLIQYAQDRADRKAREKRGRHAIASNRNDAYVFQRLARREGAAFIALHKPGTDRVDALSEADLMAAAWSPLFGHSHATTEPTQLATQCASLFQISDENKLQATAGAALVRPITAEEVVRAIEGLGARKAAGEDRLSNDFYRDWKELLAPCLTREYNRLLRGGRLPSSFTKAIVVPVPKGGDPANALNYRPISLLQSSYKIYTKVLAERVQDSLATVINADQNGFVRGRALANNVNLLRAILEQDYPEQLPQGPSNPAVILLDFMKAYDMLNRDYVLQALRMFGYPDQFITAVANLHHGTTGSLLVNGELSETFTIVTGIRQGCPLAPLLFLIAAETLKHAIDADTEIRGITIQGHDQDYNHVFSAFVDDSVVFLAAGHMVGALERLLERFGALSGLQVQPHKSHAIVLNRRCTDDMLGPFPVVPVGETVTYLGVEMGLASLTEINWDRRLSKIDSYLGIVSKYTTSIPDRVAVINLA